MKMYREHVLGEKPQPNIVPLSCDRSGCEAGRAGRSRVVWRLRSAEISFTDGSQLIERPGTSPGLFFCVIAHNAEPRCALVQGPHNPVSMHRQHPPYTGPSQQSLECCFPADSALQWKSARTPWLEVKRRLLGVRTRWSGKLLGAWGKCDRE